MTPIHLPQNENLQEMKNADWGETPKWLVEATTLGHFIPPSALELISEVKTRTGNHLVVDRSRGAVGFDLFGKLTHPHNKGTSERKIQE